MFRSHGPTLTKRTFRRLDVQSSVWTEQKYWTVPCEPSVRSNFLRRSKIRLVPWDRSLKVVLYGTIRKDDFLLNTVLQCWNNVGTVRNNVATLCCPKNRRCESSRVSYFSVLLYCIAFPSPHDYDVKMPNFTFYGVRKQANTKFSFSFWTSILFLRIQLPQSSPTFDNVSELK